MPEKNPIRVYLLDDHDIVRRGLASLLESEPDIEIVGQSGLANEALEEILRLRPDVAVLDAHLPDGNGLDVCREMRSADPGIKAMILTSYQDDDAISAAILAGAAGYILKQIEGNSLVSGIRLVASGHSLIDRSVAARVMEQVEFHKRSVQVISDLTPQQSKILFLIADGLTNREIAERLFLAEKTVKNHVTALLSRLGVAHRTQAALLAQRLRGETPMTVDTSLAAARRVVGWPGVRRPATPQGCPTSEAHPRPGPGVVVRKKGPRELALPGPLPPCRDQTSNLLTRSLSWVEMSVSCVADSSVSWAP
ncbi:response regulator transcription factor [Nocardioides stalactiti]|uniref:response regulator transcription factor n=1 Tax=Nocardioides stalactiti TaxID=2755356 RepID=UPI0028AF94C9|nr:response regulator transcription factor [Nocardioides stalactiti]